MILIALTLLIFLPLKVISQTSTNLQTEDKIEESQKEKVIDYAIAIEQAIVLAESNGKPNCGDMPGLSGEKGCHQFMPRTWKSYAREFFGYVPEQTPDNATKVARFKIRQWLDQGYSEEEIFLTWNQGNKSKCKAGINPLGVPFDSCAYVAKCKRYLAEVINNKHPVIFVLAK